MFFKVLIAISFQAKSNGLTLLKTKKSKKSPGEEAEGNPGRSYGQEPQGHGIPFFLLIWT